MTQNHFRFDTINVNLKSKPEWFLAMNPLGKVPTIKFESDKILYESLVICDYLDEKYPEPKLHPSDCYQKAVDKMLVECLNKVIAGQLNFSQFLTVQTGYRVYIFFQISAPAYWMFRTKDTEEAANYLKQYQSGLEFFEKDLVERGSGFYGGDFPKMVDYMIWPWIERIEALAKFNAEAGLSADKHPKLVRRISVILDHFQLWNFFFSSR